MTKNIVWSVICILLIIWGIAAQWSILIFVGAIFLIVNIVQYRRNSTPEAKKERAAQEAYFSAATRRGNHFGDLDIYAIQAGLKTGETNIFYREYTTFSRNGESVLEYFRRVDFNSLPDEVKLWYYF